jgi:para-nitrobenzyl esterase
MKKIYLFAISLMATYQLSAQCNGRYQSDIFSTIDVTTVQYGSSVDLNSNTINLMMDIYQPQGDVAINRPLIILAHGGSFSAGTKNDPDQVYFATELAKKGYVCATINYRLAPSAFSLIAEETTVKVVFMAIQDGKAAIRFFRKDAATTDTYKIDPDQIFVGGTSAGAILGINLTYLDDISDLSSLPNGANWQTWMTQVGGFEGSSGNPGYCSRSNGTFGFAGGIADPTWIDPDDVPWYGSHADGDQTVQIGYGQPLNGFTPVFLYGSDSINGYLNNVSTYAKYDRYAPSSAHPPFNGSSQIMADNKDSLAVFLYNILDCNPNNLKKATQKDCGNVTSIIEEDELTIDATIYPNPFNNDINIAIKDNIDNTTISIINAVGKVVLTKKTNSYINNISLSDLPIGMYFVKIVTDNKTITRKVIKR